MSNCSYTVSGAGTQGLIENQIGQFTQKGDVAFDAALSALSQISSSFNTKIAAAGLNLTTEPAQAAATLPDYTRPTPEPDKPSLEWVITDSVPAPPTLESDFSSYFSNLSVPELSVDTPELRYANTPSRTLPNAPDSPAPIDVPVYPEAPSIEMPSEPQSSAVVLPALISPNLDSIRQAIASLRGTMPEAPSLPQEINYLDLVNSQFSTMKGQISDTVSGLVGRISTILAGGTGIPDDVAIAIRNRAYFVEDRLSGQAEQTALTDWLSRGFTLPGGALEAKLADVRQQTRDKRSELNLSLWIEESKQEIENMRFAVQQGIAYEGMRKDALTKLYGIAGTIATKSADVQIGLIQAAVNIFEAKTQLWQAQFATFRDEIQAELGNVEIYKAQIQGQQLVAESNRLEVDIYKTKVSALDTQANLYKTQIDAANSLLQAEMSKLQYAAERIKIYTAEIGAWETEWKAYGESVRAELGKVELFKGLIQGFSSEVEAYAKGVDAAKAQASLDQDTLRLRLSQWTAQLEKHKVDIQAESVRIGSLSDVYQNEMRAYALKHEAEKTYVGTELQKLDYLLNVDRFNSDVTLKVAGLEQDKVIQLTKVAQDSLDAVARTSAQLAGSAMSAMNVGATISSSSGRTNSSSCTETHSYTY